MHDMRLATVPPVSALLSHLSVDRAVLTPEGPGFLRIDERHVVLRARDTAEPAGWQRSNWFRTPTSGAGGASVQFVRSSDAERGAAQGVRDALAASGLLTADWRTSTGSLQQPGTVRLWLGLSQRYLEAPTNAVPAAMQQVIDAVDAWYDIASKRPEPAPVLAPTNAA